MSKRNEIWHESYASNHLSSQRIFCSPDVDNFFLNFSSIILEFNVQWVQMIFLNFIVIFSNLLFIGCR